MKELWARLSRWFADELPSGELRLRPPASPEAIEAAEAALGRSLPDDFRASLAVHDGQDDEPTILWLPSAVRLGSLDAIVECFRDDETSRDFADTSLADELDATGRVRQMQFDPDHVAFAGSTYWDYDRLSFDFHPGPAGNDGQVIARADIDLVYVCDSFASLMEQTVRGLVDGRIVLIPTDPRTGWTRVQWLAARGGKPVPYSEFYR